MAVIQIRYSAVSGNTPTGLANGQLAINIADGILFWIDDDAVLQSFNFLAPQVPTLGGSDNSTSAANTAFVQGLLASLVGAAPSGLNTLSDLAAAINDDPNFYQTINNVLVNVVRFDVAQGLNGAAQAQAQANIGLTTATLDGGTF
jgi:hypothetical protein